MPVAAERLRPCSSLALQSFTAVLPFYNVADVIQSPLSR